MAIQDLDEDLKDYYNVDKGVLVAEAFDGDPAAEAGIRANDIILSINGKTVESSRDLTRLIAGLSVGSKAKVEVSRDGKIKTFKVKIARREDEKVLASGGGEPGHMESKLGIEISDITPDIAKQFNLSDSDGVIVVDVAAESKGAEAGIAKGDIIIEINHQPVKDIFDYNKIVEAVKDGDALQLYIKRLNKGFMVVKLIK